MKLRAPLFIINEYVDILHVYKDMYKVIVFNARTGDSIVSYTYDKSAYDRIALKNSFNPRTIYCSYTLRQAYISVLSDNQISILNFNYDLYKR